MTQQITCSINDACKISGLGKTTIYALIGRGVLDTTQVGRRRLVKTESLRALLGEAA